jgi:hypothetical protein
MPHSPTVFSPSDRKARRATSICNHKKRNTVLPFVDGRIVNLRKIILPIALPPQMHRCLVGIRAAVFLAHVRKLGADTSNSFFSNFSSCSFIISSDSFHDRENIKVNAVRKFE